mgnify:CR=1 FL=1
MTVANKEFHIADPKAAPGGKYRIDWAEQEMPVLRQIKIGMTNGDLVEVKSDLSPGENIVTRGSLFIDRAASGS